MNAYSVVRKTNKLKLLVPSEKPDIVCMTETWLTNDHYDEYLDLGFTVFREDRDNSNDGLGVVLIAVRSKLNPNLISIYTELKLRFIKLKFARFDYEIGIV